MKHLLFIMLLTSCQQSITPVQPSVTLGQGVWAPPGSIADGRSAFIGDSIYVQGVSEPLFESITIYLDTATSVRFGKLVLFVNDVPVAGMPALVAPGDIVLMPLTPLQAENSFYIKADYEGEPGTEFTVGIKQIVVNGMAIKSGKKVTNKIRR